MLSNTTALPRCFNRLGVAADGLIIAPLGEIFPRNTAIPVLSCTGLSEEKMTS